MAKYPRKCETDKSNTIFVGGNYSFIIEKFGYDNGVSIKQ